MEGFIAHIMLTKTVHGLD